MQKRSYWSNMGPSNLHFSINIQFIVILLISCLLTQVTCTVKSAQTYKHISAEIGQLVTSSALVWESYTNDPRQLEYAVQGGEYLTEDEHYPIMVCRALVDGIYTSGHTEKRRQQLDCVVSMHMEVKTHHAFDLLINRGHGAKLTWKPWNKFKGQIPTGAVSASGGHHEYVGRHAVSVGSQHHQPHAADHHHMGADYNLGRFDPKDRLGKIIVIENENEMAYEEGEILVETEPVRYELREIKIDSNKSSVKVNQTELGFAILTNVDSVTNVVETVISYEYDKYQFWGNHDGVARGLPTHVYETNTATGDIEWGLKYNEKRVDTKTVSTNLLPGTALNVTLKGNYTSMEAPYHATLVSYYADNDNSISKKISSVVQKGYLYDIKFEFSPIYFIENGTVLTTTTTTTTTTEPTSTSTKQPKPVHTPPVIKVNDQSSSSLSSSGSSSQSSSTFNQRKNDVLDDMLNSGNEIVADESRENPITKSELTKHTSASAALSVNEIGRTMNMSIPAACLFAGIVLSLVSALY